MYTQSGSVFGLADLRTAPPGLWLPIPWRKWSPDTEHSPPAPHFAEQGLLGLVEQRDQSCYPVSKNSYLFEKQNWRVVAQLGMKL